MEGVDNEGKVKQKSYIWNTVSGMINAGQSALILIFLSHMYSIETAGVFSIGYAISLLGMTVSKYGQRNYQVTDVNEEYSFSEYSGSRWVSVIATTLFLAIYLAVQFGMGRYSLEKTAILFLMCLWKQVDSVEDVYYGMYQQRGRLDIGAKRYSERLVFSTSLFCLLSLFKLRFLFLILIVDIFSWGTAAFLIQKDVHTMLGDETKKRDGFHTARLLWVCLTLCISSALAVYIGNLPKFFIDYYLEDAAQAKFGYLMMPAFVVMVLSMVIFQPIIREMGEAVNAADFKRLNGYVRRQLIYIAGLTGLVLIAGGLAGIPVLSILYHVDLSMYRKELLILFVGGGFYAISQFMIVPIVSMRKQNDISVIYTLVTALSMVAGVWFVSRYEIIGASVLYLIINVMLSTMLMVDYVIRVKGLERKANLDE